MRAAEDREDCMRKAVVYGAILAIAVATGGCVAKSKYGEAVAETDTVRTELEKTQTQKSALEQQVKNLKDLNSKLTADTELALAELQRIKDSRDKERASVEGRIKEQEHRVRDLTAQHRSLRSEYEQAKRQIEKLKTTVVRYQKELKEHQRSAELASPPGVPRPPAAPQAPPPAQTAAPKASAAPASPQPQPAPVPASQPTGLGPVNVNKASINDLVLFLGVTKDVAERVVANRPYRVRGELVAKNVLPKATFDVIKDRITVAQ